MQSTYTFLTDTFASGGVVLVYNTKDPRRVTKHVANMDRVAYRDGVVYVDGINCFGYTFARKP